MPHQCTNCGRTFADGSKEMLSGCPDCGGNKFQFRPAAAVEESPPSAGENEPADSVADHTADADPTADHDSGADPVAESSTDPGNVTASADSPETADTAGPARTPDSADATDSTDAADSPDTADPADVTDSADATDPANRGGLTDAATRAGAAVRDRLSRNDGDEQPVKEDSAQATARSDVVSREELSAAARDVDTEPTPSTSDTGETDGTATASESVTQESSPEAERPDSDSVSDSDTDKPDLAELREELNDQFESIKIVSPGQYELNLMELYDRDEYIISLQEDGRYVIEVPDRWREDDDS